MIELDVEALGEAEAKEAARGVERGLDQPVELQIGLDLALVEIELGLAPLLGEMAPVPWRDFEIAALVGDDALQRLLLLERARDARRPHRFEQIERGPRGLGHRVGEAVMGEAFIAHEPRALGPELHHLGGDGAIVGLAAFLAPRCPGAKGFLAQIAPGRELQERFDARARQGDGVFARMAALDRDARGALRKEIRQAVEIALGEQHQPVFFVRQHILAELGAERRQPLADRGEAVLGFGREACASAGEIEMITLEHARLFGRKPERVLARLQGVDAPEQGIVQIDVAAMAREDRGDLAFDRLDLVIARGAGEIEEDARHFVARLPAALQRLDGVGEGRRLRIGDDGVDLRPRPGDGGVERGPEMRGFDALERRRLERPGPGFEKRVSIDVRDGHEDVSDGAAQRLRDARAGLSQYLTIPATMQNASSEPPAARRPRKLFSPRRLRDRYDLSRPFRFGLVKTKKLRSPRARRRTRRAIAGGHNKPGGIR